MSSRRRPRERLLPPGQADRLALRDVVGGVHLPIKAVPGAARSGVQGVLAGALKVRVAAPPEDGRANDAIVRLVAELLGLRRSDVVLLSGAASRDKLLLVAGLDGRALRGRLSRRSDGQ